MCSLRTLSHMPPISVKLMTRAFSSRCQLTERRPLDSALNKDTVKRVPKCLSLNKSNWRGRLRAPHPIEAAGCLVRRPT